MKDEKSTTQLNIEIPADLEEVYSNLAVIAHSSSEFVIDFIRVMPNTPSLISYGATAITKSENVLEETFKKAKNIFSSIGIVEEIDESLMNEIIPVNGSMPAFLYYFVEAYIEDAVSYGIPYESAKHLACEAVIGSAKMILEAGKPIDELINDVAIVVNQLNIPELNRIIPNKLVCKCSGFNSWIFTNTEKLLLLRESDALFLWDYDKIELEKRLIDIINICFQKRLNDIHRDILSIRNELTPGEDGKEWYLWWMLKVLYDVDNYADVYHKIQDYDNILSDFIYKNSDKLL